MPIPIKGVISSNDDVEIYQMFGYSTTSPNDIENALNSSNGQPITLEINSPGGDVMAGSEIYTALKSYQQMYNAPVTVNIVGQAASAASIVAMAGSKVAISPTAQLFIHRASTDSSGNADDFASTLSTLNSTDQAIVNVYAEKTGMKPEDIYEMMTKETAINAKDALQMGFADEIMFSENQAEKVTNLSLPITNDVIQRVKVLMKKAEKNQETPSQPSDSEHKKLMNVKLAILFKKGDK